MLIFARHELAAAEHFATDEPALLLEGDWPADDQRFAARHSLDESIDARHAWIDVAAAALAEQAATWPGQQASDDEPDISLAVVNALALRYYFVRLLRPIAFLDDTPAGRAATHVTLHAARQADDDYAHVVGELCRRCELPFHIHWHDTRSNPISTPPRNGWLRRAAARLNELLPQSYFAASPASGQRVLLCGNPHLLDPICGELLKRSCRVAWLYDRFAFGCYARWRPRGVVQFTCDATSAPRNRLPVGQPQPLVCRNIDLAAPVAAWLRRIGQQKGGAQSRQFEQVSRHMDAWRPDVVVLDQDATPLARIVACAARQRGVKSMVVQHGAPRVRFGFSPLLADRFLAWGNSSADQLAGWGVPRERVSLCGSTRLTQPESARRRRDKHPTVLLFATTRPSDARPDAVEYHFTSRTHDESLRMAMAAVAGLSGARLIIKLHPRAKDGAHIARLAAEFPSLHCRIVRRHSAQYWLQHADVVLNCGSSAGIEAAYQGARVIELLPAGSHELTPASTWGLFGSASRFDQLCELIDRALSSSVAGNEKSAGVFSHTGSDAARAAVDVILGDTAPNAEADIVCQQPALEAVR